MSAAPLVMTAVPDMCGKAVSKVSRFNPTAIFSRCSAQGSALWNRLVEHARGLARGEPAISPSMCPRSLSRAFPISSRGSKAHLHPKRTTLRPVGTASNPSGNRRASDDRHSRGPKINRAPAQPATEIPEKVACSLLLFWFRDEDSGALLSSVVSARQWVGRKLRWEIGLQAFRMVQ